MAVTRRQGSTVERRPGDSFGANLTRARHAAGLSVAGLAQASGVPAPTISRYEHGRSRNPHLHILAALARALDVTPADLLGDRASGGPDLPPASDPNEAGAWLVTLDGLEESRQAVLAPYLREFAAAVQAMAADQAHAAADRAALLKQLAHLTAVVESIMAMRDATAPAPVAAPAPSTDDASALLETVPAGCD